MARTTLASIIEYVRVRVGDTGTAPAYSDDMIQVILDGYRRRWISQLLFSNEASGYTEHTGPTFSENTILADADGVVVEPSESDEMNGYFVTATEQPALYITCFEHDPANAIAELLQLKLSAGASGFVNVSTGRHSIARGQARATYNEAIRAYRKAAKYSSPGHQAVLHVYRNDFYGKGS